MSGASTAVAFTPSVKAEQARRGSREHYRRVEERGGWSDRVSADLAAFLSAARSVYLATANASLQPYIQHRGGPAGFLHVLDEQTLGFADYGGNRQYITLGNLADNPRAFLFVMDYARRIRVKIWGRARVVEGDAQLLARLSAGANVPAERCILFEVEAWDRNCPQHIPVLVPAEDRDRAVAALQARISQLEQEIAALRLAPSHSAEAVAEP